MMSTTPDSFLLLLQVRIAPILLCLLALPLIGCATYGFADHAPSASPAGDGARQALFVETLASPAHLDVDAGALRTLLVEELHRTGISTTNSLSETRLRCSLANHRPLGTDRQALAEVTLECTLFRPDGSAGILSSFSAYGIGQAPIESTPHLARNAANAGRDANHQAAADALRQIALSTAQLLLTAQENLHEQTDR